jgi:ABC-2 type transport system ATP-binding protein
MEQVFREAVLEAKQRGQTVFLSSHILSEVEALCDRVGILREGRLVDQGTLAELRHLSAHTLEVTFAGPRPQIPALPAIHASIVDDSTIQFEVTGALTELLPGLRSTTSRR